MKTDLLPRLTAVRDWSGREFRLGDLISMSPLGIGRIDSFVSAGIAYVDFDEPRMERHAVRIVDIHLESEACGDISTDDEL